MCFCLRFFFNSLVWTHESARERTQPRWIFLSSSTACSKLQLRATRLVEHVNSMVCQIVRLQVPYQLTAGLDVHRAVASHSLYGAKMISFSRHDRMIICRKTTIWSSGVQLLLEMFMRRPSLTSLYASGQTVRRACCSELLHTPSQNQSSPMSDGLFLKATDGISLPVCIYTWLLLWVLF